VSRYAVALSGILAALVPFSAAQAPGPDRPPGPNQTPEIPPAGFWPTPRLMENIIDRIAENMAQAYAFDEDQLYNTRQLLKERFPAWLNAHRPEIMQLTNEYFEALTAGEPPDPAYVASWAQRMLPLINEFTDLVEATTEEMRSYMTDEQQVVLDGHMAAFRVGMSYMTQRLGAWSEGGFDPENEWWGNPRARREIERRDREMHRQMAEAERQATGGKILGPDGRLIDPPQKKDAQNSTATAPTQDTWAAYTEEFIRRYRLDSDQQAKAYRFLRAEQQNREKYLRRRASDFETLRKLQAEAQTEADKARLAELSRDLQQPLDRMFQHLKERLETLPTRKQRLEAAQAENRSGPAAKTSSVQPAQQKADSPVTP
jgi:hypothetical protein